MNIKQYALQKAKGTKIGARLVENKQDRVIAKAVVSLVFNLLYGFYNGILGIVSSSLIFVVSAVYYLLLCAMRFSAVLLGRNRVRQDGWVIASAVGVMLIILSVILHIMVIVSMKQNTAASYGTITMIAIAAFTFAKISAATITAVRHKGESSALYRSVNAIRYSEVAVSLLTVQQSMLVSFDGADPQGSVILNACTGAGVCFFILALGILTLKAAKIDRIPGE